MASATIVILVLSSMFPAFARRSDRREEAIRRAAIVEQACRAEGEGVSCSTIHAMVFVESGYRLRQREAPLAGCHPYSTDDRQQAACAVRALMRAVYRCGDIRRALARYQYGECDVPRRARRQAAATESYVSRVLRISRSIERAL